jgi:hypothetical protein
VPLLPALALVAASTLAVDPPWLVKEFTPETIAAGGSLVGTRRWLSAGRFRLLGIVGGETPAVAPRGPRYRLLDLERLATVDVEIPFKDFPREHLETLGIAERQGAELVHHDGGVTTMLVDQLAGYRRIATWIVQYDHRARRWSRMVKLGDHDTHRYLHPIGFDPRDARYYFAYAVNDEQDATKHGPLRYELARVDLRTLELDWQVTLALPRRAKQLTVGSIRFSPDGSRLALASTTTAPASATTRRGRRSGCTWWTSPAAPSTPTPSRSPPTASPSRPIRASCSSARTRRGPSSGSTSRGAGRPTR